jgi:hypothetical protein
MEEEDADRYRCRRIYLKQSDNPACQAQAACEVLMTIDGILLASPFDLHSLHIIYSLDKLSFEIAIDLLRELNFETNDSLLISLRNTIFCFLEDNARDNLHIDVTEFEHQDHESPEIPHQDEDKYWEDYH